MDVLRLFDLCLFNQNFLVRLATWPPYDVSKSVWGSEDVYPLGPRWLVHEKADMMATQGPVVSVYLISEPYVRVRVSQFPVSRLFDERQGCPSRNHVFVLIWSFQNAVDAFWK